MALVGWPVVVDDSGSGQDGTVWDAALNAAQKASIENDVTSTGNPTVRAKAIIDEVVTARGTTATLDTRLDVALNEDGTLKAQATLPTLAQTQGVIGAKNLVPNDTMLLWSLGDALAPDYYTLSGAGAAVARCGTALADPTTLGFGDFCARVTFGAALSRLSQELLSTTDFARATGLKGRQVGFGAKVKTAVASHARIVIDDGVSTTASAYHTGGGAVEWLSVVHTMSGSATKLTVHLEVAIAGAAYFGALTALLSGLAPLSWVPCAMQKGFLHFSIAGVVTTGANKGYVSLGSYGIVTDVQIHVLTAPTGAALIVDVGAWDGISAFATMFTTSPTIAIAAFGGGGAPDGVYARRCLGPNWGTALANARSMVSFGVAQVGSVIAGSDLVVEVRVRQFIRELESLLSFNV